MGQIHVDPIVDDPTLIALVAKTLLAGLLIIGGITALLSVRTCIHGASDYIVTARK